MQTELEQMRATEGIKDRYWRWIENQVLAISDISISEGLTEINRKLNGVVPSMRLRRADQELMAHLEKIRDRILAQIRFFIEEKQGGYATDDYKPKTSLDLRRDELPVCDSYGIMGRVYTIGTGEYKEMPIRRADRYRTYSGPVVGDYGERRPPSLAEYLKDEHRMKVLAPISPADMPSEFNEMGNYGWEVTPDLFDKLHNSRFDAGLPIDVIKRMRGEGPSIDQLVKDTDGGRYRGVVRAKIPVGFGKRVDSKGMASDVADAIQSKVSLYEGKKSLLFLGFGLQRGIQCLIVDMDLLQG